VQTYIFRKIMIHGQIRKYGALVNTSGDDFGPYVTADKFLFYESGYSSPSSIYCLKR
jgi:hypothetical protein